MYVFIYKTLRLYHRLYGSSRLYERHKKTMKSMYSHADW